MKVALIGGTGFVGGYLVDELIAQNHPPVLLVRSGSEAKVRQRDQCALIAGDVKDPAAVRNTLQGCDAVIYNIGLLREFKSQGITFAAMQFEGAARTIDLAVELGVKRFLLMSANGVKAQGTPYQTTKYRAEECLKRTDLEWTIFRPSVIFGDPRGAMEFCTQLYKQMIKPAVPAPLFYDGLLPVSAGSFGLSPIHIKDVAAILVKSLTMPEAVHKTFGLCGPQAFEWKAIIKILAKTTGRRKLTLPAPAFLIKSAAALLDGFEFFPVTRDQLTMLLEGNTCDSSEVFKLFGITPIPFNEESLSYLRGQ